MNEFFCFSKKIGFWGILGSPSYGIGATIRIGREMLCLPYAGFLKKEKHSTLKKTNFVCTKGKHGFCLGQAFNVGVELNPKEKDKKATGLILFKHFPQDNQSWKDCKKYTKGLGLRKKHLKKLLVHQFYHGVFVDHLNHILDTRISVFPPSSVTWIGELWSKTKPFPPTWKN